MRQSSYHPIFSFYRGRDSALIEKMIRFYCSDAQVIVDVTCNRRTFWVGSKRKVICMDINPSFAPDVVGDYGAMPFKDASVDLLVFDPPHLPTHAASPGSSGIWRDRYGITDDRPHSSGDNISPEFDRFLAEAKRVLKAGGLVFAKIADIVHNHRYQWQHVALIMAAERHGFTPCDLIVSAKVNAGSLKSSLWKRAMHARKAHCYFIVLREGRRCEP